MTRIFSVLSAAFIALALSGPAIAQTDHSGHSTTGQAAELATDAAAAFRAAMDIMHGAMSSLEYSGEADIDFARGMIPHHQAAIDMARIVLEHGKDSEIRKLAEDIIEAQEREIKQLETWLAARAK
ncbi:DUF305 domain-containing protein [Mesorhizobium sp. WSM2239]|jgi:uncharacterized protein (DUF305 family)|uniref:DUF305 domain-containing protein n=2 Tax=unclassified Mesorhizobium TaxID=325217 RepID=A0AAU8DB80_9HYPH